MFVAFLEFGAGPGGEVAVAGAVDVNAGFERAESVLAGDDEGRDIAGLVAIHRGEDDLKQHFDAVFGEEIVVNAFELFGVDGDPVDLIGGDVGCATLGSVENGFGESAVDDLFAVGERTPCRHERGGAAAAERLGLFEEKGAGAGASGGRGGGATGGTAAYDDDVPAGIDFKAAGEWKCWGGHRSLG